jgi:hypothetical protein
MEQVAMWIVKDELLHTESCSGKILFNEVQLTQFLPSLLVTHKPETDGHVSKVIPWLYFYHVRRGNPVV